MVERTCLKCGHKWVIPKRMRKVGRRAAFGGVLGGNLTAATVLATKAADLDTCTSCGSVRYFKEGPVST